MRRPPRSLPSTARALAAPATEPALSGRWIPPPWFPTNRSRSMKAPWPPWNSLMWSLMTDVCRAMGVRTDVPFRELSEREKEIVFHGPAEKKHILYRAKNSEQATELDFTYFKRHLYRRERPLQGQGRKGHEAGGKIFKAGALSGLRRDAPVRAGQSAQSPRAFTGSGLPDEPFRSRPLGGYGCLHPFPRR